MVCVYYFRKRIVYKCIHSLLYIKVPGLCHALFTRITPRVDWTLHVWNITNTVCSHASY